MHITSRVYVNKFQIVFYTKNVFIIHPTIQPWIYSGFKLKKKLLGSRLEMLEKIVYFLNFKATNQKQSTSYFCQKVLFFFQERLFLWYLRNTYKISRRIKSKKNSSSYSVWSKVVKDFLKEHLKFSRRDKIMRDKIL